MSSTRRVFSNAHRLQPHMIVTTQSSTYGIFGGQICLTERSTSSGAHRQTCFGRHVTRYGRWVGKAFSSKTMFIMHPRQPSDGRYKPLRSRQVESSAVLHRSGLDSDAPQGSLTTTCILVRQLISTVASKRAVFEAQQMAASTRVSSLRR